MEPDLVNTTQGLIDRARLERTVHCTDEPGKLIVAVEWRLGPEMVRRDVWINILRGMDMTAAMGEAA
ncbi:MAG: hypothetical protein RB191_12865 [Terriglobia bacterium]|nr:hypothetical protein [Terriglobia bacterium]